MICEYCLAVSGLVVILGAVSYWWSSALYQSVAGRHVCITGGSSGIGLSLAKLCAERGARKITLIARRLDVLESAAAEVRKLAESCEVAVVSCDITEPNKVDALFSKGTINADSVDWLFNCAGMSLPGRLEDTSVKDILSEINVNYLGSVYMTRALVPSMKARGSGRLVFLGSQASQVGVYGLASYTGSKYAVRGFAEALRQETEIHNVQVCVVYPPDTDTPGLANENKRKPQITKLISETSGLVEAATVATTALDAISRGSFNIWCGVEGFMLSQLTSGLTPGNSLAHSFLQIGAIALFKVIGLFTVMQFDWIIHSNEKKPYEKPKRD